MSKRKKFLPTVTVVNGFGDQIDDLLVNNAPPAQTTIAPRSSITSSIATTPIRISFSVAGSPHVFEYNGTVEDSTSHSYWLNHSASGHSVIVLMPTTTTLKSWNGLVSTGIPAKTEVTIKLG